MRLLVIHCHPFETRCDVALRRVDMRPLLRGKACVGDLARHHTNVAPPAQMERFKVEVGQAMRGLA